MFLSAIIIIFFGKKEQRCVIFLGDARRESVRCGVLVWSD
jgi:hypothetical protein